MKIKNIKKVPLLDTCPKLIVEYFFSLAEAPYYLELAAAI